MNCEFRAFNVEHGDCLGLRIENGGEVFTMLIDGGKPGSNIADRLFNSGMFPNAGNGKVRIDLLVATHHDKDHLGGLVEVVEDDRFEIERAWAPIVLKPSFDSWAPLPDEETFTESAIDNSERAVTEALTSIERSLSRHTPRPSNGLRVLDLADAPELLGVNEPPFSWEPLRRDQNYQEGDEPTFEAVDDILGTQETLFEGFDIISNLVKLGRQNRDALGCGCSGLPASSRGMVDPSEIDDEIPGDVLRASQLEARSLFREGLLSPLGRVGGNDSDYVLTLATVTTRAAYNIKLTAKFIRSCQDKGIPVEMPQVNDSNGDLKQLGDLPEDTLRLLSPTKKLVQHYKEKLVMPPEYLLLSRAVNYVTLPNKISYVFNIKVGESTILFTGDSGFTDFRDWDRRELLEDKIDLIRRAQIVKVPHHGGHFERFGQCVLNALSRDSTDLDWKIFLTSLGSQIKNPGLEFEELARTLRGSMTEKPEFHFTNRPLRSRFDGVCDDCPHGYDGPKELIYFSQGDGNWILRNPNDLSCCERTV